MSFCFSVSSRRLLRGLPWGNLLVWPFLLCSTRESPTAAVSSWAPDCLQRLWTHHHFGLRSGALRSSQPFSQGLLLQGQGGVLQWGYETPTCKGGSCLMQFPLRAALGQWSPHSAVLQPDPNTASRKHRVRPGQGTFTPAKYTSLRWLPHLHSSLPSQVLPDTPLQCRLPRGKG